MTSPPAPPPLADDGTWAEVDADVEARVVEFPVPRPYTATLAQARERSGQREAVRTGRASIGGHPVVLAAFSFSFLGGTLGVGTGAKLARALEVATTSRLPFVLVTASGGVRVQEGVPALLQMPRVAAAAAAHRRAGLLQVAVLGDPSKGGVSAGFALAADVLVTTPEARIGFTGARIAGPLGTTSDEGRPHARDLADVEAPAERHPALVAGLLSVLRPRPPDGPTPAPAPAPASRIWPPTGGHLVDRLRAATDDLVVLGSDRRGAGTEGIATGFARIGPRPFGWVAVGDDGRGPGRPGPGAYAKATRHVELAGRLGLPLVSLVDLAGADSSPGADAGNVAGEIAATTAAFATCDSPTAAFLVGLAGSGGAVAVAGADLVVMDPAARFYVLPPAAVAALVLRDAEAAATVEPWMSTSAQALRDVGVVDRVSTLDPGGLRDELVRFLSAPPPPSHRVERWSAGERRP